MPESQSRLPISLPSPGHEEIFCLEARFSFGHDPDSVVVGVVAVAAAGAVASERVALESELGNVSKQSVGAEYILVPEDTFQCEQLVRRSQQ